MTLGFEVLEAASSFSVSRIVHFKNRKCLRNHLCRRNHPNIPPKTTEHYLVISVLQCFQSIEETKDRSKVQMFYHVIAFGKIF